MTVCTVELLVDIILNLICYILILLGNQTLLYVLDNAEIIIPKQTDFKI